MSKRIRHVKSTIALAFLSAVLCAACGGNGASSLDDAKRAVIQIEAMGSFIDPEVGLMMNVAGRGSGFIIDPSGIAVTNNHVVTGAAKLEVWIGGEAESHNAKVLGVSECSDLAVIDIDGDGYPYLTWYEGSIPVGMDVYAAGFPLGDPEYTLTRGIVSKEKASGESPWSSVDEVIEHDATINPGNSGGPLITPDGEIVGINYMGSSLPGTQARFFAIARDEAVAMIETMRSGEDVDSIGINGEAVNTGEGLSGIWVSSVKSGSPADVAGIKGGDIIVTLEGLVLSTDYSMSDYCDILRTHDAGDTLDVQVLRFSTGEFLEGQINGRTLQATSTFGTPSQGQGTSGGQSSSGGGGSSGGYSGFMSITDSTGVITVSVPNEWNDIYDDVLETENGARFAYLVASPDYETFQNEWVVPGVSFMVTWDPDKVGTIEQILDDNREFYSQDCDYDDRYTWELGNYQGGYDLFANCSYSGGPMAISLVFTQPSDPWFLAIVQANLYTDEDVEAFNTILSFMVISEGIG